MSAPQEILPPGAQSEFWRFVSQRQNTEVAEPNLLEEERMQRLLDDLHERGIEAEGRVGYVTSITTNQWHVQFTDQRDYRRGFLISHKSPEVFGHAVERDYIESAIKTTGFSDNPDFKETRKAIAYETRIVITQQDSSAVQIVEEELARRMNSTRPQRG